MWGKNGMGMGWAKMAEDDVDYQQPGQKKNWSHRCKEIRHTIWNSEKGEFLGRTAISWAKIGVFYLIFYSCLAGFFAIMLTGFFQTLSDDHPKQTGLLSLIKGNPGMGFRPMIDIDSTLIRFNHNESDSYKDHLKNIEELLKPYGNQSKAVKCGPDHRPDKDPAKREVCRFDLKTEFGDVCTKENKYGYSDGKPCIIVKINKVYGWEPKPFSNESLQDPDNKFAQEAVATLGRVPDPNYIAVTCEGENPGDKDNILNTTYYPADGYSFAYFPYYNTKNYLAPLVFVQFDVRKGALIQVWCKLWVSNIKHHKNDKAGSTHFELLVD